MQKLPKHNHNDQISRGKAFALGIGLNITFVIIEIVYGLSANSSALLEDAGHIASDVLGLVLHEQLPGSQQ